MQQCEGGEEMFTNDSGYSQLYTLCANEPTKQMFIMSMMQNTYNQLEFSTQALSFTNQ